MNTIGLGRVLSLLCVALIAFTSVGICHEVIKCNTKIIYELFEDKFKEPFEICYILMSDNTLYKITSHDENKITFNFWDLEEIFKKNGHEFSDILIVIHNHMVGGNRDFSWIDIQTWYDFKAEGFTGNYYLLYQGSGQIYELIEDEDDS